jgi:hypothetical protein
MFETMVRASEANLASVGAAPVETFTADAGYWSVDNVTMATDAELRFTPMPATKGALDPDDPPRRTRGAFERVERKELSLKDAAA